ncbi:MAG: mechanosensitive ion channel domain-containing protein [Planctomycetota bacterium]
MQRSADLVGEGAALDGRGVAAGSRTPQHGRSPSVLLWALSVAVLLLCGAGRAQETQPVDAAAIEAERRALAAEPDLPAEVRAAAQAALDAAAAQLDVEAQAAQRTRELRALVESAPAERMRIDALLLGPTLPSGPTITYSSPLADLDAALVARRQDLLRWRDGLAEADRELKRLAALRPDLPRTLADLLAERSNLEQQLASATPAGEAPAMTRARRLRQRASLQSTDAGLATVRLEQESLETLLELQEARRGELGFRTAQAEAEIERLQQVAADRRREEIDRLERRARAEQDRTPPTVQDVGRANLELIASHRRVLDEGAMIESLRAAIDRERKVLAAEFEAARRRIQLVGLTETIGIELRQLRQLRLTSTDALERRNRDLGQRQIAAFEARFGFEDALAELSDPEAAVAAALAGSERPPTSAEQRSVRTNIALRREILERLVEASARLTTDYAQTDTELQLLREEADACEAFIDERVLWIPSAPPIWESSPRDLAAASRSFLRQCQRGAQALGASMATRPVAPSLLLAAVLVLAAARRRLLRGLQAEAARARLRTTVSFVPTFRALLHTLLLAAPLPLLLAAAALLAGPDAGPTRPGLGAAALVLLALGTVRQLVRADGLGDAHFAWPTALHRDLRRSLRWLTPVLCTFAFISAILTDQESADGLDELARLAVLPPLAGIGVVLYRLLHPSRGSLLVDPSGHAIQRRFRHVLFLLALAIPCGLAGIAVSGYAFTALELYARLDQTLVLTLGVLLGTSLVFRWLLLSRRALAIQQARERRRALRDASPDALAELEEQAIDLAAVDLQTRSLVRAVATFALLLGAWAIWVDVLPALGVLRNVELWDELVSTTVLGKDADGNTVSRTVESLAPITLANLLLAILVLIGTFVLARNFGGLLEIALLRHLNLQAGERYAFTTITRYAIVAVGVLAGFGTVGLGWAKVQWLIAAVSLGLGFGLQEIFANFVSGLILLFERPIRVGDLISIGTTDGRVSRIQMRATTIVDFDRKELVVPNREFITGKFVNWSLTSPVTRIVVPVGVSYDTDTDRAQELLLACARSCPSVLSDPAPHTVFCGFGASALDLELRIFIADMDRWADAMNEIHRAITRAFRDAGIEIAFPQQDIHIRSARGLDGVFASVEPAAAPAAVSRSGSNPGDGTTTGAPP